MTAPVQINVLGLDTSACSVGYIAGWSDGDTDTITETAKAVLATVHELAEALDDSAAQDETDKVETDEVA